MNELRTRSWADLPLKTYQIVYADPPWAYYGDPNKHQACGKHYDTMSLEELIALPVPSLLAKRAVVLIWATCPKLDVAFKLIEGWGLHYRGVFHNWIKTTQGGKIISGQGARPSFTKATSELLLVASTVEKGRPLPILDEGMAQVIAQPRPGNVHSRKPSICRENIVTLYGTDVRKIELFARTSHPGWDAWGNQVEVSENGGSEGSNSGESHQDRVEARTDVERREQCSSEPCDAFETDASKV